MTNINEYAKKIAAIEASGKFPPNSPERGLLGLHSAVSAMSEATFRQDHEKMGRRFGAIMVNLLSVANQLGIDADAALAARIAEIEESHGTCEAKQQ